MPPKQKRVGGKDEDVKSMLVGISSAHSWIKTQTMIRPTKLGKSKPRDDYDGSSESDEEEDDFSIYLSSQDPNVSYGRLRYVTTLN